MTDLYKTDEWKSLSWIDRAQLLLVMEGLKRGTTIEGSSKLIDIAKKAGLECKVRGSKYDLFPVIDVARPEVLAEEARAMLTAPQNADKKCFDLINGRFYGYPQCCVEEYVRKPTKEEIQAARNGQRNMSYRFGRELTEQMAEGEKYPEVLDYRVPSFTPCSVNCQNSTEILANWKNALETLDPDAAEQLKAFNKKSHC